MLKMKVLFCFVLMIFVVMANGCSHEINECYLIRHPERLRAMLDDCQAMGALKSLDSPRCQFAMLIFNEVIESSRIAMKDHQDLGKRILESEARLVMLKEQISSMQSQKDAEENKKLMRLQKEYKDLTIRINVMLTLVAQDEGM